MKWIPTSERVPEKEGKFLVTREGKYVDIADYFPSNEDQIEAWFLADACNDYTSADITAWMELPEPYKGEGK